MLGISKDDFEAVAYKVLSYLYACLKTGAAPSRAKALEMSRVLAEDAKSAPRACGDDPPEGKGHILVPKCSPRMRG